MTPAAVRASVFYVPFCGKSGPRHPPPQAKELPADIEWHFIGHLQTNKLKMVLPYASIVESVDSLHLLEAIDRWGRDNSKVVDVLLEFHVAAEETKQGFDADEIRDILFSPEPFANIRFRGLMGMATLTSDEHVIEADFGRIVSLFDELSARIGESPKLTSGFNLKSFGMTDFCTVLFSQTNSHHFHNTAFIRTSKCCMRFYATAYNNSVSFSSVFINKYIAAFFIFTDIFNFHRRYNRAADIIFCYSVSF